MPGKNFCTTQQQYQQLLSHCQPLFGFLISSSQHLQFTKYLYVSYKCDYLQNSLPSKSKKRQLLIIAVYLQFYPVECPDCKMVSVVPKMLLWFISSVVTSSWCGYFYSWCHYFSSLIFQFLIKNTKS